MYGRSPNDIDQILRMAAFDARSRTTGSELARRMTLHTYRQSIEKPMDGQNSSSEVWPPRMTRPLSDCMLVDDHPQGYPQLAAFVNSDENFLVARKYGFLRSRVLLYRQDELSVLEKDLIALDDDDKEKRELALRSRKHDEETDKDPIYSRKVLIQKIDDKLKEYGKHLPTLPAFRALRDAHCYSR